MMRNEKIKKNEAEWENKFYRTFLGQPQIWSGCMGRVKNTMEVLLYTLLQLSIRHNEYTIKYNDIFLLTDTEKQTLLEHIIAL